jgi:uncharacterized membrane protein
MFSIKHAWTDRQMDAVIGILLRVGVSVSSLVVLAGGVLYLMRHGATTPDYRVFQGEPSDLRSLPGIVQDALSLRARGVIQLGLLLLIATPILRVAFTVLAFALQRDRTYVVVTLIVLSVLLYSLTGGSR